MVFILLFVSPYVWLLWIAGGLTPVSHEAWLSVVARAGLQASLSATLSLLLGFVGALGLLSFRAKRRRALEGFALLPGLVPSLFVLLSVFNLFGPEIRGLSGVILVQVLLYTGPVSVFVSRVLDARIGRWADLAWVEGATRAQFLRASLPALMPEWRSLFLFVGLVCFSSFAVPLVMGGAHASTLEVLISQRLRESLSLKEALYLALLQWGLCFAATRGVKLTSLDLSEMRLSPLLCFRPGLGVLLAVNGISVLGLLSGSLKGVRGWLQSPQLLDSLLFACAGSVLISISVGVLTLALLFLAAWLWPYKGVASFLQGWTTPSGVLAGFAFLLLPLQEGWGVYAKLAVALTFLNFPSLYRAEWQGWLSGFARQREVATSLGASPWLIATAVLWPQLRRPAWTLAGLSAFWAGGEFAVSQILAEQNLTLALLTHKLIQSYRLEMATALVWALFAVGGFVFFLFWSCGYVLGAKSDSRV